MSEQPETDFRPDGPDAAPPAKKAVKPKPRGLKVATKPKKPAKKGDGVALKSAKHPTKKAAKPKAKKKAPAKKTVKKSAKKPANKAAKPKAKAPTRKPVRTARLDLRCTPAERALAVGTAKKRGCSVTDVVMDVLKRFKLPKGTKAK